MTSGIVTAVLFDNRVGGETFLSGGVVRLVSTDPGNNRPRLFDNRGRLEITGARVEDVDSFKTFVGSSTLIGGSSVVEALSFKNEGGAVQRDAARLSVQDLDNRATGDFLFQGGRIEFGDVFINQGGATFGMSGGVLQGPSASSSGRGDIENEGSFQVAGGLVQAIDVFRNGSGGVFDLGGGDFRVGAMSNRWQAQFSGGVLNVQTDVENSANAMLRVLQQGRIARTGVPGASVPFRNAGVMELFGGTIEGFNTFETTSSGTTTIGVAGSGRPALLSVLDFTTNGDTTVGPGGRLRSNGVDVGGGGSLVVAEGGDVTLSLLGRGNLANRGSIVVDGANARLRDIGDFETVAGSTTTVEDGGVVSSVTRYFNSGLTTVGGGGRIAASLTEVRGGGEIRVDAGGVLASGGGVVVESGATLALDGGVVEVAGGFVELAGEMLVTGDARVLSIGGGGAVLTGPGSDIVAGSAASLDATVYGGGNVFGVDGPIELLGSVVPGAGAAALTAGQMDWIGDVSLGDGAELVLELLALDSHDSVELQSGTATLGGTLRVRLGPDYVPADGDIFEIVTTPGGVISGQFAAIDAPALTGNLFFDVEYSDGLTTLRVVPTPGVVTLIGVAGLIGTRRRR